MEQGRNEFYRKDHKLGGILSRQDGESMSAYCQRRRRWYAFLQDFDPTVQITDEMRGDMMLDNANLTKTERLLIMTSTKNSTKQDDIEEALREQLAKIHLSAERPFGGNRSAYPGGRYCVGNH